jgi:hypothetical protein
MSLTPHKCPAAHALYSASKKWLSFRSRSQRVTTPWPANSSTLCSAEKVTETTHRSVLFLEKRPKALHRQLDRRASSCAVGRLAILCISCSDIRGLTIFGSSTSRTPL